MSNYLILIIESILNFLNSALFILILFLLIIVYHILLFFMRDTNHIKALKKYKDPEVLKIEELNELPLVNITIPAWKESKLFEDCLQSITKLKYPNLKIIVSAGGNEETIKIADSFKSYSNFTILRQKPGGKMKALNDCLNHVSNGIIYSIDADVILTDEILLRMIYPITNENEYVTAGGVRPLKSQEHKSLVKYLLINRSLHFRIKFSRYGRNQISGPNSCLKYEVIKAIGKFEVENFYLESDRFRGPLISDKGYKIYWISDYRGYVYTYFPESIKKYIKQEIRWRKNSLTNSKRKQRKKMMVRFLLSVIGSLFILSFPIVILFNVWLAMIGILLLVFLFLKKIRKYLFLKYTVNKKFYPKFGFLLFFKMFFYSYIENLMTAYLALEIIKSRIKRKKKEKNNSNIIEK